MIQKLKPTTLTEDSKKLSRRFNQFNLLVDEINKKEIAPESMQHISEMIAQLESRPGSAKLYAINIRRTQTKIIRMLQKDYKIVTKNYYRNLWMAIGMSAFGIPLGVAFGSSFGNMGYIGIGIPLGLLIGMVIGAEMDKKAAAEGRQLNVAIEH